jgi:hypothetical protein
MKVREAQVKDYLFKRVHEHGGEIRNVQWIGRNHCPDTRVMLPWIRAWVETKRPGKTSREGQQREHERMRRQGELVFTLNTKELIDWWLEHTKDCTLHTHRKGLCIFDQPG